MTERELGPRDPRSHAPRRRDPGQDTVLTRPRHDVRPVSSSNSPGNSPGDVTQPDATVTIRRVTPSRSGLSSASSLLRWSPYRTQCLAALAALDLGIVLNQIWVFRVLVLIVAFSFPGILVLDALRVPRPTVGRYPAIVVGASVAVMMVVGGVAHVIGHAAGIEPLSKSTLVISFSVTLIFIGGVAGPGKTFVIGDLKFRKSTFLLPVPVVTAAAGAITLNHGGPSVIAVAGSVFAVAGILAALVLPAPLLDRLAKPLIFSSALALLYAFSLRSNYVYGWDISQEYRVLSQTASNENWTSNVHGNAYAAMLSITMVPAMLVKITGLDGSYVFKLIYPCFAALIPVTIYALGRQYLPARFAVAGPVLILAQQSWSSMIPALARQELGLFYFALLLVALMDPSLPARCRLYLGVIFGAALVLSHYSSTYISAILFVGTSVLAVIFSCTGRRKPSSRTALIATTVTLVVGAMIWYVPVTHSTSELSRVASGLLEKGPQILPNKEKGSFIGTWLNGNTGHGLTVSEYNEELEKARGWVVSAKDTDAYPLASAPAMPGGDRLAAVLPFVTLGTVALNQLTNLLAIAGTVVLLVTARRRGDPRLLIASLLSVVMVLLLASLRLSAAIAEAYNQERMMVQALEVLSLAIGMLLLRVSALTKKIVHLSRAVPVLVAASVGFLLANNTGMISYFNSGNAANFANRGEDYERFYEHAPEVASAQWLTARIQPKDILVTDRYGQLRMALFLDRKEGIVTDLAPAAIDKNSYVYLTTVNMEGRVRAGIGRNVVMFATPFRYLDDTKGVVYANFYVKVYR